MDEIDWNEYLFVWFWNMILWNESINLPYNKHAESKKISHSIPCYGIGWIIQFSCVFVCAGLFRGAVVLLWKIWKLLAAAWDRRTRFATSILVAKDGWICYSSADWIIASIWSLIDWYVCCLLSVMGQKSRSEGEGRGSRGKERR